MTTSHDGHRRLDQLSPEKRALIERRLRGVVPRQLPAAPITPRAADGPAPLSFAQQRLWFLDQLAPGNPFYTECNAFRLQTEVSVVALHQSLNEIVRRHEILRTTFSVVDGEPVQIVAPQLTLPLAVENLGSKDAATTLATVRRLVSDEAQRPFDLRRGPLIRVRLFQLGKRDYILVLTMHHIISDGWSMNVFTEELTTLYTAFVMDQPSPLPELSIQYADFAVWQRNHLQGQRMTDLIDYWKTQLADLPALELPTTYPRPAEFTYHGTSQKVIFPDHLTAALNQLSKQEGVTLFMTMLAAFKTLLYRYTGQMDIVVGFPIANRNRAELESLIGFFVNTLVLRTDLAGDPTFRELLQRVRQVALAAYSHQDLPFEKLVEVLQPARDLSRNPLFQVIFQMGYGTVPRGSGETNDLATIEIDRGTAKFDLRLDFWEGPLGLEGRFEYSTDLFSAATIERMIGHYQVLLQAVCENSETRLSQFALLTGPERKQLLDSFNATQRPYPDSTTVHAQFAAQAARTPDAAAIEFKDQQLTYAELDQRANQLARRLQQLGVGLEGIVGLCCDRSPELIVAMLGILKAGGAYLPLDPTYPLERLQFMLADTDAAVLLTKEDLQPELRNHVSHVLYLDEEWTASGPLADPVPAPAGPDNLVYIMYTSGSTGRPKGTSIRHRSVLRLVQGMDYVTLGETDVVLQFASPSFDAATFEIWGSLLNGSRLILVPGHAPLLDELAAMVRQLGVTTLWLTAGLFHQMVQQQLPALRGVRQLLAGGDILSVNHVVNAATKLNDTQLINGYGPTENTTFTTCYHVDGDKTLTTTVPIGRPIANTQVYVLDNHLNPVPVEVYGELYIGGAGLARGYWRRPVLTAEKFIPNPFVDSPGARLYRTGDIVRWREDGQLEFRGRRDQQIKVRGYRIELGEIEAVLGQHPGVREVIATAERDVIGEQRVTAYVVGAADAKADALRLYLQQHLPPYMVPAFIICLDEMPLTANGKVDRRALPAPGTNLPRSQGYTAPETQLETQIATIWQAVLQVPQVGVDDNFFDIGGHSLIMVQVHGRLQELSAAPLSMIDLFQYPTIRLLAQHMAGLKPEDAVAVASLEAAETRAARQKQARRHRRARRDR